MNSPTRDLGQRILGQDMTAGRDRDGITVVMVVYRTGPALKGTTLSADQIADLLTKGDDAKKVPHKKAVSGVSADDAKAVAAFVKTLK